MYVIISLHNTFSIMCMYSIYIIEQIIQNILIAIWSVSLLGEKT